MTETTITVQGQHTTYRAAEHATVQLAATFDGSERSDVFDQANRTASGLRADITALHNEKLGPVIRWSSNNVRTWSDRPWNDEGKQLPMLYHSHIDFSATFSDFDSLARFIESTAEAPGVSIGHINWELSREHAKTVTNEVRTLAVQDAVAKATTFAQAVGLSSVTPIAIADPGMLESQASASSGGYELASARGVMMDGGTPELSLKPEEIAVSVTVDARFAAN